MCSAPAMDGSCHGRKAGIYMDAIDDADHELLSAPPSGDPACFTHVDACPVRDTVDAWVDGYRATLGLRPVSAAAYRNRTAQRHLEVAAKYVELRQEGHGAHDSELCRQVQAAMETGVVGSCAWCGCNFSVKAVVDMADMGRLCGLCLRSLRLHQAAPVASPLPANAEERFQGWKPW